MYWATLIDTQFQLSDRELFKIRAAKRIQILKKDCVRIKKRLINIIIIKSI